MSKLNDICGCHDCELCFHYALSLEKNKHLKELFYKRIDVATEILKALIKNDSYIDADEREKSMIVLSEYVSYAVCTSDDLISDSYEYLKNEIDDIESK